MNAPAARCSKWVARRQRENAGVRSGKTVRPPRTNGQKFAETPLTGGGTVRLNDNGGTHGMRQAGGGKIVARLTGIQRTANVSMAPNVSTAGGTVGNETQRHQQETPTQKR